MAVAKMRKVTIFAYEQLHETLFERLRDLELIQITKSRIISADECGPESALRENAQYLDKLSELSYIKSYFERYNAIKKGFIDMFTGKKPEVLRQDIERLVKEFDVHEVFATVKEHDERLKEISKELTDLRTRLDVLSPWKELDIPVEYLGKTSTCENGLAIVPLQTMESFRDEISGKPIYFDVVWETGGQAGIWIVGFSDEVPSIGSRVSSVGGTVVTLLRSQDAQNAESGLVKDIMEKLERRNEKLLREQALIRKEDSEMAQKLVEVLALIDYYLDKKNLDEVKERSAKTNFTLVIEGYVRAKDIRKFRKGLSDFKEIEIIDEEPENEDEVPIYLENHPLIRPFEVITNIFGYPKYNEVDPTPILAPFFWIFFGICLADALYGVALVIGSWYFLKTHKLSDGGQKLVKLLMYSGISTAIIGALMGSWMGDLASVFFAGTAIEKFVKSLAMLNPIEDPLTLLVISLAFGILQVWVGIIVKMYSLIKEGQVYEGIISQGSWVLFLPGLIGTAVAKAGYIQSKIPFYVMVIGAFMVMYSASRGQKNILLKPFAGVYGLYSTIGYFSDTMSYARLLALGLASAIIGVVINKISQLVVVMIPKIGWVFVPLVLIGGHLFNLAINVLGGFIHSGRLQFVEFFTKFFEGGGKPFKPLTRVSEYVSVSKSHA